MFDPAHADVEVPELARLGPDPIADGLTAAELRGVLAGRSRQLKALLLDQHAVAGLGNIYSDEVLHVARLRFDRPAGSLDRRQVAALHGAMMEVLAAAIEAGGSTLADAQYVGLLGEAGQLPARAPGVRAGGRAVWPLRQPLGDRPGPLHRPLDLLLPPLPALGQRARSRARSMRSRSQSALARGVRTIVS